MEESPKQKETQISGQTRSPLWLWIVIIIGLIGVASYFAWYFFLQNKTQDVVLETTNEQPVSAENKPIIYTNDTYGFTLSFPVSWKGYKMKEVNFPDSTQTYYINVPTKDQSATSNSTAEAGYFSPFEITVYTLPQWTEIEKFDGPKDTLIAKSEKYAFGWSHANGTFPTDFSGEKDMTTIIASFKLKQ